MSKSLVRTVSTSMIGNLFEFYDFALFGYFAPIIGKLFFPSGHGGTELIAAFGAFAAGFLVRPLGGLFFGHIGDRYGRKKALVLSIILMAVPTALIGLLPTYDQIGMAAPLLLVLMRVFQGISLGGNYGGSITFTAEHTAPHRRGFIGSIAVTSCLVGILLGSGTAALFSSVFTEGQLQDWGWRVPFLLGILICFVGYYMRLGIPESPEYLEAKKTNNGPKHPIINVFQHHGKVLTAVVLTVLLHDLSFYLLMVYMATYFSEVLHVAKDTALIINTISLVVVSVCTLISGWLSDKVGRKPVLMVSAFLFIVGTIPLLKLIIGAGTSPQGIMTILGAQIVLAMAVGAYFGPIPALMAESFPTMIRYSAVTITTNISGPLFGGVTPMIVTYLIAVTGSALVPAYYLVTGAVISFIALQFLHSKQSKAH